MKKAFFLLILLIIGIGFFHFAPSKRPKADQDKSLIDQIKSHQEGTTLWWAGHDGWLIKSGDILVGTDLLLEDNGRIQPSPISAYELAHRTFIFK